MAENTRLAETIALNRRRTVFPARQVAYGAAWAVALVGGVVLAGWALHLGGLVRLTGEISMKVNTALAFGLSGLGLLLLLEMDAPSSRRWAGRLCGAVVLLLGTLTLAEHVGGWNLGIDQLLAREPAGMPGVVSPGRMGPPAALCFTVTGFALVLLSFRERREYLVQALAGVMGLITLLPAIGYLYNAQELYGDPRYTAIAPVTAWTLLLLSVGLLCARHQRGLVALLMADDPGGSLVRRLLLPALLLPVIVGSLRVAGEQAGLYDIPTGMALVTACLMLSYIVLVWFNGERMSRLAGAERAAQDRLRGSEQRYHSLFENMREGFAYCQMLSDEQGRPQDFVYLRVNASFYRLTGMADVIGKRVTEVVPGIKEQHPELFEVYGRVARGGDPERFEVEFKPLNAWLTVSVHSPEKGYFVAVFDNITERKRADEELKAARNELEVRVEERTSELNRTMGALSAERERFHEVLNALPVYVVLLTPDYHVAFANRVFRERFGQSKGARCFEHLFQRSEPCLICETYKVLETNAPRNWAWRGPDGRDYDVFDFPFTDTDGSTLILEMGMDQTQRKRAEAELEEYKAHLEVLVSQRTSELEAANTRLHAEIGERVRLERRSELLAETMSRLLRTDSPQGVINELCARVMEFLDCQAFFNFLVDEERQRLRLNACGGIPEEAVRRIQWLDYGVAVCGCAARDGCRIVAEDIPNTPDPRTDLVKSFGIQAYACHPLKVQERVLGTLSFGARNRVRFSDDDLSLMKAVADHVAIAVDRQRAQAQLQRLNEELERRVRDRTARLHETIAELEHFSYAITHDMRAPLRAMQGFAEILEDEFADGEASTGRQYLRRIRTGANRLDQLITDSLNYSKAVRQELTTEPVDLGELVLSLVETYPNLLPEKADIQLQGRLPTVIGNEAALTQCFSNLLGNAVKFARPGVKPQVRIWAEPAHPASPSATPPLGGAATNGFVRIWLEDNGIGIPAEARKRIFGMFQRAATGYEGTGIGLAIVRKVVERMGGKVGFESEEGKGSRFWVELASVPGEKN